MSGGPVIKPFDPFSQDASALRKTLVGLALPAALFAAVVAQLTVVNRLPLPGGDAPDLVLLLVAAASVVTGSTMVGAVAGFAGGLALDVAPPASHYAGEYALIFCLAGYLAARVMVAIRFTSNGDAPDPSIALAVLAVATAAGEAGKAGLGMLLSDPNVTGPTIRHVLPGAVLYDLLLTPVVYWLVATVARLASPVAERAPAPVFFGPQRLASVFRAASTGAVPNLRLAGTGAKFTDDRPVRREPRLRLTDARSNSFPRTVPAGSNSARVPSAGGRAAKLNFAHSRSALTNRGSAPVGRAAKLHFAGDKSAAIPPPRRRPSGPGKGWLGSGRRKPPTARLATPGKGWLRPARRPRANWYSNGPTTSWIRRSRTKDRWRSRRRSLSGSLLSTVRDLLPTGERR